MKKITLQLEDINGLVEQESEVLLCDGDTLVMQYPENMSIENANKVYKMLKFALEKGTEIIGVPNSIVFKVIKK